MSQDTEARLEALRAEFVTRYEHFVYQWIVTLFADTSTEIDDGLRLLLGEFFLARGKALRPIFFITAYQMEQFKHPIGSSDSLELRTRSRPTEDWIGSLCQIPDAVWDVACALEVFHGSLLAIDDLLDHGTDRRGKRALHLALEDWASQRGHPSGYGYRLTLFTLVRTMVTLWNTVSHAFAPYRGVGIATPIFCRRLWDKLQKTKLTSKGVFRFGWDICDALWKLIPPTEEFGFTARILGQCYEVFASTLEGEILDLEESFPRKDVQVAELTYPTTVRLGKKRPPLDSTIPRIDAIQYEKTTAYSVWLPILLGVALANPDRGPFSGSTHNFQSAALRCYSIGFGSVFQIADDLLITRSREEIGKDPMSDLRNGTLTTVTAAVYELLPCEAARNYWSQLLAQCRDCDAAVEAAMAIVVESGSVEEIIDKRLPYPTRMCDQALDILFSAGYDIDIFEYILLHGIDWMDDARHQSKITLAPYVVGTWRTLLRQHVSQ